MTYKLNSTGHSCTGDAKGKQNECVAAARPYTYETAEARTDTAALVKEARRQEARKEILYKILLLALCFLEGKAKIGILFDIAGEMMYNKYVSDDEYIKGGAFLCGLRI